LRQFERFQQLLLTELNLKPAAETLALCTLIQNEGNIQPLRQVCGDISTRRREVYETLATLSS
jgi:hypothetical protein